MTDHPLPPAAHIAASCNSQGTLFYDVVFEPEPEPTQLAAVLEQLYATLGGNPRVSSGFVFTQAKTLSVITHDADEGDEQFSVYRTLHELFQPSLPYSAVVKHACQIKQGLATLRFMLAGTDRGGREVLFEQLNDDHLVVFANLEEDGTFDLTVRAELPSESCRQELTLMFEELDVKFDVPEHYGAFGLILG